MNDTYFPWPRRRVHRKQHSAGYHDGACHLGMYDGPRLPTTNNELGDDDGGTIGCFDVMGCPIPIPVALAFVVRRAARHRRVRDKAVAGLGGVSDSEKRRERTQKETLLRLSVDCPQNHLHGACELEPPRVL